jgi:hypothetical protein
MKTFGQLFEERRGVVDNGPYLRSNASELFTGTGFALREGMPSAPSAGVLLGIAFYSLHDLMVLDEFVQRSRNSSQPVNLHVQVFDILVLKSMQDVEAVYPGLAPAFSTPMIGVWEKGELIEKGCGVGQAQRILGALFAE